MNFLVKKTEDGTGIMITQQDIEGFDTDRIYIANEDIEQFIRSIRSVSGIKDQPVSRGTNDFKSQLGPKV